MSSTFTTNKTLEEPAQGDYSSGSPGWSTPMNSNFTAIDVALGGSASINVVGASGVVALTLAQYKPPILTFSGALTANVNYQLPTGVGGTWSVYNNTSGAFSITVSSAGGGSSVVVPQGYREGVGCDGTNVFPLNTAPNNPGGANGQLLYNSSGLSAGSANLVFSGSILSLTGAMRFYGSTSGYAGLQAAAATSSVTWTLPAADGTNGQGLTTNGAGVLSWQSSTGVSSFSGGSTGLLPSSPTSGAVSLSGTLSVANGGTGATTSTGSGSVVLATSPTIASPTITGLAASTGAAGLVALATAAQILAGVDTTHAATPASLTSQQSIAANGYYTLPGGLIIQWGHYNSGNWNGGSQPITFPLTFPNAVLNVQAITDSNGITGGKYGTTISAGPTTTGMSVSAPGYFSGGSSNINGFYWVAIGY